MNAKDPLQKIMNALEEMLECYRQLIELAREQQEALDANDDARLFRAVDAKNAWVKKAHQAEQAVTDEVQTLPDQDREMLKARGSELKDRITQTLAELIELEETCAKSLEEKKIDIYDQLGEFKKRRKGIKGYESF